MRRSLPIPIIRAAPSAARPLPERMGRHNSLWKVARDETGIPGDRLMAYARWRRAVDRVKVLADHLLGAGNQSQQTSQRDP